MYISFSIAIEAPEFGICCLGWLFKPMYVIDFKPTHEQRSFKWVGHTGLEENYNGCFRSGHSLRLYLMFYA